MKFLTAQASLLAQHLSLLPAHRRPIDWQLSTIVTVLACTLFLSLPPVLFGWRVSCCSCSFRIFSNSFWNVWVRFISGCSATLCYYQQCSIICTSFVCTMGSMKVYMINTYKCILTSVVVFFFCFFPKLLYCLYIWLFCLWFIVIAKWIMYRQKFQPHNRHQSSLKNKRPCRNINQSSMSSILQFELVCSSCFCVRWVNLSNESIHCLKLLIIFKLVEI